MTLKDKLYAIEQKFKELNEKLGNPKNLTNPKEYGLLAKAHAQLQPLAYKITELNAVELSLKDAAAMRSETDDPEMASYFEEEIKNLNKKREILENELKELLLASDPNDEKDVIMEIRAGTGGNEASLFASDLFRMYSKYAEKNDWKTEIISSSPSELGGFKEIIFSIQGSGVYSKLKFESGVHRVQRVPVTESSGRIHTSASTVAVLPEAEDVEVDINPNDLRIDIFRSSGPGGQSVNTTDSAVRINHLPTGLVVQCQDQKSQTQNKEQAMRVLRARLYERLLQEQQAEIAETRRLQVGTGDRSERIRTYNFPQGRVTDHRIGLTLYKLDLIMEGELDELAGSLIAADRTNKLEMAV